MNLSSPIQFTPQSNDLRYGFRVAGVQLVPAPQVLTEMVVKVPVFPVPHTSSALVGVINLRGTLVPLFDPNRLGKPKSDMVPVLRRAVVFGREEQRMGLLLDVDPEMVSLVPASGQPLAPISSLSPFLSKVWASQSNPHEVWWEFNHFDAFDFMAKQPTVFPLSPTHSFLAVQTEVIT